MSFTAETIKQAYESGVTEINGREYEFDKINFRNARKVFAFFSSIVGGLEANDISFIDSAEFDAIEKIIRQHTLFDGHLLQKLGDAHFEEFSEDYISFVIVAMGVFSYPFTKGSASA